MPGYELPDAELPDVRAMGGGGSSSGVLRDLWACRSTIIIILTPIILLPLPLAVGGKEACTAYGVILMGVYWMTEVVPLPVTALMPIFLFPALGVIKSKDVAVNYMKDTNFLFIGGLIIAVAVEESGLHQRIALRVLLAVGTKARWLMAGIMSTTWFLSMWISNTATTAMMLPIVEAVLAELIKQKRADARLEHLLVPLNANTDPHQPPTYSEIVHEKYPSHAPRIDTDTDNPAELDEQDDIDMDELLQPDKLSASELKLCRCLLLATAYSANIGGTGTLTGTPPNIVMAGLIEGMYGQNTGVSFASWMMFSLPGALINLVIAWLWLQLVFLGWRHFFCLAKEEADEKVRRVLERRYNDLGSVTWAEGSVLSLFICLVFLWLFRDPKFMPGWVDWVGFKSGFLSDGSAAIFISFFLFFLPFERPDCMRSGEARRSSPTSRKPLLEWSSMQKKFPWGIVLLLGGGFALGGAVKESGLSVLIGKQLEALAFLSPFGLCLVSIILMTFLTGMPPSLVRQSEEEGAEVTSNTATASIFIPILTAVAERLGVNPLYFVLAITVCASFAFMLPVATPPNAIVFGSGLLRVVDMMMVGFVMNWLGIIVMTLSINTWTYALFNLGTYPDWAPAYNHSTTAAATLLANATTALP